ncbi:uncharacterized protein LOC130704121 [Daphnia carinata]|uniref:uncharacterized protein LOC130704121 n=1 Tax=Daphnia carinata TaxID=120202 RepID=UPI002580622D|nr:uncharacterized protein LOC130704121 [Daphnia carinata]
METTKEALSPTKATPGPTGLLPGSTEPSFDPPRSLSTLTTVREVPAMGRRGHSIAHLLSQPTRISDETVVREEEERIKKEKLARKNLRRKISMTCTAAQRLIESYGSRGAIQGLVDHVQQLLVDAEEANVRIAGDAINEDVDEQYKIHLTYVQQVGVVTENFRLYREARRDDATTRASSQKNADLVQPTTQQSIEHSSSSSSHQEIVRDNGHVVDLHPNTTVIVPVFADEQHGSEPRSRGSTSRERAEAEQALQKLTLVEEERDLERKIEGRKENDVQEWCQSQQIRRHDEFMDDLAPDTWIDLYREGRLQLPQWSNHGAGSTIKAELEDFHGQALEWFTWIDLFRALVHDTTRAAAEKLAILKRRLRGECADIVHGPGGGETAYVEALTRLKETYGRRDVMRAALVQALDKLEMGRQDPNSFRRFAEKTRTYLFDLNRIGETATTHIIDRICLKLQLPDRLAWNEERGTGLEKMNLLTFGRWLCKRAAAYQNAHSLAAEQFSVPTIKPPYKYSTRSHSTNIKMERKGSASGFSGKSGNGKTFCFQCEGSHRLEVCPVFNEMATKERLFFCIRRRLCFICFGPNHSSRECKLRKPCTSPGCKHWHHFLLHDEAELDTKNVRPAAARVNSKRQTTAVAMLHLDVFDADGHTVKANVFVDEGSDSTLFRDAFIRRLRLSGVSQTLSVDGAGAIKNKYASQRVQLQMKLPTGEIITLVGSTMPTVASPVPTVDWGTLKSRWTHLADLPITTSGGRVDILLGSDVVHLTTALESRIGRDYEPTARWTRIGWIVRGAIGDPSPTNAVRTHTIFATNDDVDLLAQQFKRFCDTEDFGIEHRSPGLSETDKRAIQILESGVRKLEVGYEAPITWKTGEPSLPNNRILAESRLESLLR